MANDITVIREYLAADQDGQTSLHAGLDGVVIGRWDGGPEGKEQPCEVILNDPGVSRIHAGINQLDGQFFIINLSLGNVLRLNGRWVKPEESDILADGDVVQIGPFFISVTRKGGELVLRAAAKPIEPRRAASMSNSSLSSSVVDLMKANAAPAATAPAMQGVINVFWDRRKKREKAGRPSPLHPRRAARPGKVRWNWQPTRDLARPWPISVFIWATVLIAAGAGLTVFVYARAFSPAPLSSPHQRGALLLTKEGKIANKPNANSCLTCHSVLGRESVDSKCATCHQADGFHSSNTKKHTDAGITCTVCHLEHQGADYQPKKSAFATCAQCHNDNNPKSYNGEYMKTPHRATYGYPVKFGKWVWMGLEKEVLELKPDVVTSLENYRRTSIKDAAATPESKRQQELNWQFHAIHMTRVKAPLGVTGVVPAVGPRDGVGADVDKAALGVTGAQDGVLSCSSCHKTTYPNLDRNYPIEVCAKCHNGYYDESNKRQWVDDKKPNCTSCHVQHYYDKYRWGDLLVDQSKGQRGVAMDDKTVESIVKPTQ